MKYKDYYKIMGVERDATQDAIKRAYRKLARKYHPDVSKEPDAEEHFKEVNEAYEVLKDPEKRSAYDQLGSGWHAGDEFKPPPGWEQGFEVHFGDEGGPGPEHFSDFFEALFGHPFAGPAAHGGRTGTTFRMRGADQHLGVEITVEEAYTGSQRTLRLQSPDESGRGVRTRTLNVKIPAGVTTGRQIRLSGQGAPGMGGGPSGDLYLEVHIRPHRLYRVDGQDLYLNLPVAPWEAALGATVAIPSPGGQVELKVPAGSQSGRKLRLRARGLPGHPAGDLYAVLQIVTPQAQTEKEKELYRRMERELPFDPRGELRP